MTRKNLAHACGALAGALALTLGAAANADVTIEERMSISGAGLMSMANMSGTTRTIIARDRARTESNLQFESGMLRTLARGAGESVEIVRLDQDKIYLLNPRQKTYTETTFSEQRAQLDQAMEQSRQAQASQQQAASGVDESNCEWSEPKADLQRTGEKTSIAGYDAERVTITATQSCTDRKTGQVCDFSLVLDQWLAPDFEASEEALAYQRAYAEKLGFNAAASRDFAERAEAFFGRYPGVWNEVATKMRGLEGYPVRSSIGLGVGGPQCNSASDAQASGVSGATPSISGAIGGALGGLLSRKKRAEQAPEPQTMPNGLIPLMTIRTELVSVSRAPANAADFEVPAGYKKE